MVKDLKNLRRAKKAVSIEEITGKWKAEDREKVKIGLLEWRRSNLSKG